jgi:hypothetical protein
LKQPYRIFASTKDYVYAFCINVGHVKNYVANQLNNNGLIKDTHHSDAEESLITCNKQQIQVLYRSAAISNIVFMQSTLVTCTQFTSAGGGKNVGPVGAVDWGDLGKNICLTLLILSLLPPLLLILLANF